MRGVPEFELVSEPVEFEVVRPLDVLVKVNRPMTVGKTHLASEVVDVLLVNRSEREIEVSSPTNSADARAAILFEGGEAAKLRYKIWDGETYGIKVKLKPGEAVPLIGPSEFANGHDAKWDTLAPGMVKVRASYTTTTWNPGATILSEWVEVPVLK